MRRSLPSTKNYPNKLPVNKWFEQYKWSFSESSKNVCTYGYNTKIKKIDNTVPSKKSDTFTPN